MKMASEISKFTLNKTSPFGCAINKSLLTPCRQVGLSRKRKTPSSIVKLSTPNSKNLEDPNTTPVNHKIILPEQNINTFPSINYEIHDEQLQRKTRKTLRVGPSGKSAKKTLIQTFSSEGFDEAHTLTKPTYEESFKNISPDTEIEELAQGHHLTKLSEINIFSKMNSSECQSEDFQIVEKDKCKTFKSENLEGKLNQNEEITEFGSTQQTTITKCQVKLQKLTEEDIKENITKSTSREMNRMEQSYESDDGFVKTKSKRIRVISDDESDFQNCPTVNSDLIENKSKLGQSDKKCKEKTTKKTKPKKKCIEETNLEITAIKNIYSVNDDDAFTSIPDREQNENIRMLSNNDNDFQNSPNVNSEIKDKKYEVDQVSNKTNNDKSINKTKLKKNSMEKIKVEVTNVRNISFIDDNDDEDAFTSTPDRERNEKISLVSKIRDLEIQVKDKREKLEALKQAAIYKSKHKIPELRSLTEIWQKGCVLALNSLLAQLQLHGPIDMSILLNNLHIPIDIAKSKLNLLV